MKLRAPPRIKVLEALGAIADGRVKVVSPQEAIVTSSAGKKYKVKWDASANNVSSTDRGTSERGYVGYPVIAFLMIQGMLPYDASLAAKLARVKWRELKEKYKDYDMVIEEVLRGWYWNDRKNLFRFSKWIMDMVAELEIERGDKETKLTDFAQL